MGHSQCHARRRKRSEAQEALQLDSLANMPGLAMVGELSQDGLSYGQACKRAGRWVWVNTQVDVVSGSACLRGTSSEL